MCTERTTMKTQKRKLEKLRRNIMSVHRWKIGKERTLCRNNKISEEIALCAFQIVQPRSKRRTHRRFKGRDHGTLRKSSKSKRTDLRCQI
jgi:hypothetical protein